MAFTFPNPTPTFPSLTQVPGLDIAVHQRPTWATLEYMAVSGRRVSSPQQALPLWEFELQYNFLRDQTQNINPLVANAARHDLVQVVQLFLACAGKYGQFYFDYLWDNSRKGQVIGTGDGETTAFVAQRTYGFAGLQFNEPVGGINELFTVYINGNPLASSGYSFSGNTINFSTAPALNAVITIDFSYYYLCQFLEDQHDYQQFAYSWWELRSLKMRSVKQ